MPNVSNLNEITNPVSWEKFLKKNFKMSSKNFNQSAKRYEYEYVFH